MALALSPLAALFVVGYSLRSVYTWLTHLALGMTLAIAPVGGGSGHGSLAWPVALLIFIVATFAAGFDIFNTCQDLEFDRGTGVSLAPRALRITGGVLGVSALHVCTSLGLLALGSGCIWVALLVGWTIASARLIYEHRALSPNDCRGWASSSSGERAISVVIFLSTLLAVLLYG